MQPGHTLPLIDSPVEQRELAHLIVKEAYDLEHVMSSSGQMMSLTVRNSMSDGAPEQCTNIKDL